MRIREAWAAADLLAPLPLVGAALYIAFRLGSVVALEVPFFAAVLGSLWLAGTRAGLVAAGLSALAVLFFFVEPLYDLRPTDFNTALELFGFLLVSLLMISYAHRLSVARDRLAVTFRSLGEGVVVANSRGIVRLMNEAAAKLTGWTAREAVGRPLAEVFIVRDPNTRAHLDSSVSRLMQGAVPPVPSWEPKLLMQRNGGELLVEESAEPIRHKRALAGFVLVFRDVTERHALERQIRDTERLQSVGRLAAGIAHQFNNILTSVIGYGELAKAKLPPDHEVRSLLATVLSASQRAAKLTSQLLAYAGKGTFVVERIDLSALVSKSRDLLEASLPANVKLAVEIAGTPLPFDGDPAQLQQVLMNLVANAAEAIGEAPGTIFVRAAMDNGQAALEVEDTGCGMDQETLSRIFEPFFSTKFLGRGLGLPAVQGIARSYGGTVLVDSAPCRGSRFRVLLPLAQKRVSAPSR